MFEFDNHLGRLGERHRELLAVAAEARLLGKREDSRNGALALAVAGGLERLAATIRLRYASALDRPAPRRASTWRTS